MLFPLTPVLLGLLFPLQRLPFPSLLQLLLIGKARGCIVVVTSDLGVVVVVTSDLGVVVVVTSDLGQAHGIHVVHDGIVALLRKGAKAIVLLGDGAVNFRGVSGRDEGCGERRKDGFSHALI